ncbi:EAL domain-containing protein [Desulfotomaculum copahuensis]|uniref:EAL domain-containing protein n=1 Tax=Desulfotomaculum copahuensis TaxID=1838280 RepID=A0A1B7LFS6_9FIRM|nr:EAL domain-containing protein [Desulfotomaculum copahuensis]OAT83499.1 hypothetical protein A6M21_08180 [Desulfotomaculum copahuensis]
MEVREIIARRAINTLFQPVHDIREGEIIGFEALTRGPSGTLQPADILFAAAASNGLRVELELACFREALINAGFIPPEKLLFLNFHPLTLAGHWEAILNDLGAQRRQAVIEITESSGQIRFCAKAQEQLRMAGVRIALDDVGAGDRALANMCEYQADYLKLDRSIIEGLIVHHGARGFFYGPEAAQILCFGHISREGFYYGTEPKHYKSTQKQRKSLRNDR